MYVHVYNVYSIAYRPNICYVECVCVCVYFLFQNEQKSSLMGNKEQTQFISEWNFSIACAEWKSCLKNEREYMANNILMPF